MLTQNAHGRSTLDFTGADENGDPWDVARVDMRNKAFQRLQQEKPALLIGSPARTTSLAMDRTWGKTCVKEGDEIV